MFRPSIPEMMSHVPWWWRFGGRREFWAVFEKEIGQFIKDKSLPALSKEAQMGLGFGPIAAPMRNPTTTVKERSADLPIWWYGGMKAAHLHYKGNIYVLKSEQWTEFIVSIIDKLNTKLKATKTVNFEKTIEISETMNEMV